MVEFDTSKIGYSLKLDGKYYNTLDIEGFSHMMKDPSYCYKFYWLEAIVQLIAEGVKETTFDAVIDEMICNAWYSVREFHIHLSGMPIDGQVKDGLERAVSKLSELSNLPANASKVEIKNAIKEHNVELKPFKEQLTNMVPGRALSGFFSNSREEVPWGSIRRLTEYIKKIDRTIGCLPYTFGDSSKLKKKNYINVFKHAIEMIYILSGQDKNYIDREIQKKNSIIFYRRICNQSMIQQDVKVMRYGITDVGIK